MTNNIPNLSDHVRTQLHALALDRENTTLLLAISGGADSMALLHALTPIGKTLCLHLHAVHINHLIREDAQQDADLVAATCREHEIPCTCIALDIPAAAKQTGQSLEMEARKQRYDAFAEVYHQIEADALLTAHHRKDQAETIILNLTRGCSPAALAGIPADTTREGMRIVRPLLDVDRNQIMAYLRVHSLTWREDATNTDRTYRRNAIRHNILPAMRKHLNPKLDEALQRCANMAKADEAYLQFLTQQHEQAVIPPESPDQLNLASYRKLPQPLRTRMLVRWLWRQQQVSPGTMHFDLIQQLDHLAMEATPGKQLPLPGGKTAQQAYDRLTLLVPQPHSNTTATPPPRYAITIPGTTTIPELGCQVTVRHAIGYTKEPITSPGLLPASCHIRLPQDGENLHIRTRQDGDRIQMTGSPGHCKLQDLLTDWKVPSFERDHIPLLATEKDLIWIPGLRIAQDWAVSTTNAPSLSIHITPTQFSSVSSACPP